MVKYFCISSYIRKHFLYDLATDPMWISLYMKKFRFLFYQCGLVYEDSLYTDWMECTEASFLSLLFTVEKSESPWPEADLRWPPLRSLILLCVLQYSCLDAMGQKKAISYSLAMTRDTHNGVRETSSGRVCPCNIWPIRRHGSPTLGEAAEFL